MYNKLFKTTTVFCFAFLYFFFLVPFTINSAGKNLNKLKSLEERVRKRGKKSRKANYSKHL